MSLVFHHSPMSTAIVTHWVLEELGVPYEKVRVDLAARDQDRPAFRALNPNGKVPVVVHDGTPIFESAAITLHLGEAFGVDRGLFPPAGPDRARAMTWIAWANVTLAGSLGHFLQNTADRVPADQRNEKAAAAARVEVEKHLGVLDAALEGREHLLGDGFTIVDAHLASLVEWMTMCGFSLATYPRAAAWLARCTARPAHAASMAP